MNADLNPGVIVAGRYRLDRLLGRGGMGQVWAVRHEVTHRVAALKLLNGPSHLQQSRRRRFLREARAASAVSHPNVVRVHDFFELPDGTPVMIMDLLEGETLGQKLSRDGALPVDVAAAILLPVVSAVGTAHARGVIHRDLKPENVFLCAAPDGAFDVRVLDFGVAKLVSAPVPSPEDSDALTGTGGVVGTPSYMSPEQGFGEGTVDHRADVWSLGVVLYEVLAGSRPVDGANMGQVLKRLLNEAITPLEVLAPELPPDVTELVGRMLSRDPEGRPRDLREVAGVLGRHTQAVAPPFDAAVQEAALPLDSGPLSARSSPLAVVQVVDASDPQAATDLAEAPPVATLPSEDRASLPMPAARPSRRRLLVLGSAVAVLVALAELVASRSAPEYIVAGPTPRAPALILTRPLAPSPTTRGEGAPVEPASAPPPSTAERAAVQPPSASVHRRVQRTATHARPPAPPGSSRRGGLVDEPPF